MEKAKNTPNKNDCLNYYKNKTIKRAIKDGNLCILLVTF